MYVCTLTYNAYIGMYVCTSLICKYVHMSCHATIPMYKHTYTKHEPQIVIFSYVNIYIHTYYVHTCACTST